MKARTTTPLSTSPYLEIASITMYFYDKIISMILPLRQIISMPAAQGHSHASPQTSSSYSINIPPPSIVPASSAWDILGRFAPSGHPSPKLPPVHAKWLSSHSSARKKPRVITPPQSPVSGRTRANSLKRKVSTENLAALDLPSDAPCDSEDKMLSKLTETLSSRYGGTSES